MHRHFGYLLQLVALGFLPLLILWQLTFGFRLIVMPALTLAGFALFTLGHYLRERK